MKRDLDLARLLMLEIENCNESFFDSDNPQIDGYSDDQITYHIKILKEAGLIDASVKEIYNELTCSPSNLTWSGHEFLDSVRDDTLWNKSKSAVIKNTTSMTFGLLYGFIEMQAKEKLGLL